MLNHTIISEKTHAGSLGHTCRQSVGLWMIAKPKIQLPQTTRYPFMQIHQIT